LHRHFKVAALPEPYYNPVNLGNGPADVKKKEFIRGIGFSQSGGGFAHQ